MRNLLSSPVGSVYSVSGNEAKGMRSTDFLTAQLASQKNYWKLTQNYMLLGSGSTTVERKKNLYSLYKYIMAQEYCLYIWKGHME